MENPEIIQVQGKKVAYYFGIDLAILDALWLFPTAGPVGFQSLGLGRGLAAFKIRNGTLEPWNPALEPGTLEL